MKISAVLDDGKHPSGWLRRAVSRSVELRGIEQQMIALDHSMRQTVPKPGAPASLHSSIMSAVRAPGSAARARHQPTIVRWLPVPALLVVLLLVVWSSFQGPSHRPAPDAQSLAAATTALEMGGELSQEAPAAVVAPLSDELDRLNRDLQNTAQFLLASVP